MKKYIVGAIAGMLLMTAGHAAADGISKVGKKIQGEAPVEVNGKDLSSAIIVDGKSYAPVRDVSEALGAKAGYTKGVITITTTGETATKSAAVIAGEIEILKGKRNNLLTEIAQKEKALSGFEQLIKQQEEDLKNFAEGSTVYGLNKDTLDRTKGLLEIVKGEIAELQKQLASIDKQIADLEAQQTK